MEKLARIAWLTLGFGLFGALYGAVGGIAVGALTGFIFGDVADGISFGVFFGIVVGAIAFAVAAVLWDDGPGSDMFGWSNAMNKPAVLFLCTNNAVRSKMAEALLKRRASDQFDAYSAGTEPKEIHPLTIRVMNEVGIDLSGEKPNDLRQYLGKLAVRIAIFVCPRAEDKCPTIWPGSLKRMEWPFEDPAACEGSEEERLKKFRLVRDQIDEKIALWLTELKAKAGGLV